MVNMISSKMKHDYYKLTRMNLKLRELNIQLQISEEIQPNLVNLLFKNTEDLICNRRLNFDQIWSTTFLQILNTFIINCIGNK